MHEMDHDINPERNFYHTVHRDCKYFTENQFNVNVRMVGVLFIIHFNSRSLNRNFSKINDYLRQGINKFSVIAFAETWLKEDNAKDFGMQGYEMYTINRMNKKRQGYGLTC